jgi:GNAT superfamily N-acetyltransferase
VLPYTSTMPKSLHGPQTPRKSKVAGTKAGAEPAAQDASKTAAKSILPRPGELGRTDTIPVQAEWLEAPEEHLVVSIPRVPLPPGMPRLMARSMTPKAPPPLPSKSGRAVRTSDHAGRHKSALPKPLEGARATGSLGPMLAKIEVRDMLPDDVQAVCDLNLQLGYSGTEEQIRARFQRIRQHTGQGLFAALLGQRVVGWLHVQLHHSLDSEPYAEIRGLVVNQTDRRRGVGRALVGRAREWAKECRHQTLRARSNVQREEAHPFYSTLGFQVTKTQHTYTLDLASD